MWKKGIAKLLLGVGLIFVSLAIRLDHTSVESILRQLAIDDLKRMAQQETAK